MKAFSLHSTKRGSEKFEFQGVSSSLSWLVRFNTVFLLLTSVLFFNSPSSLVTTLSGTYSEASCPSSLSSAADFYTHNSGYVNCDKIRGRALIGEFIEEPIATHRQEAVCGGVYPRRGDGTLSGVSGGDDALSRVESEGGVFSRVEREGGVLSKEEVDKDVRIAEDGERELINRERREDGVLSRAERDEDVRIAEDRERELINREKREDGVLSVEDGGDGHVRILETSCTQGIELEEVLHDEKTPFSTSNILEGPRSVEICRRKRFIVMEDDECAGAQILAVKSSFSKDSGENFADEKGRGYDMYQISEAVKEEVGYTCVIAWMALGLGSFLSCLLLLPWDSISNTRRRGKLLEDANQPLPPPQTPPNYYTMDESFSLPPSTPQKLQNIDLSLIQLALNQRLALGSHLSAATTCLFLYVLNFFLQVSSRARRTLYCRSIAIAKDGFFTSSSHTHTEDYWFKQGSKSAFFDLIFNRKQIYPSYMNRDVWKDIFLTLALDVEIYLSMCWIIVHIVVISREWMKLKDGKMGDAVWK